MGVDIVELDVKKTKDGELILMHDRALDRTTTGKGLVSEATLDYIRGLKLKNGCNIRTITKFLLGRGLAACQRQDNDKSGPGRPLFRPDL